MTTVGQISQFMNSFAPVELAEEWDNTGLLVGESDSPVKKVMTCLTITPESATEAISRGADVIVSHHPLPFRSFKRLTSEDPGGQLLLNLIKANVAIISPHTSFDSAADGINAQLAQKFQLKEVVPLTPSRILGEDVGAARTGLTARDSTLQSLLELAKAAFKVDQVRFVGSRNQAVSKVALCCGSGGSFLHAASSAGCDAMVTGEATFHTCLEAKARKVGLILLGHHTSERFAVETLVSVLSKAFGKLEVWASEDEVDPIRIG